MKKGVLVLLLATVSGCEPVLDVTASFRSHTEFLASDDLKGRGTGSKEIREAAEYIAEQFRLVGLRPGEGDSYFQAFPLPEQETEEVNVIGYLPAGDGTNGSILFTAHYDAYGVNEPNEEGDEIYNGARDNATGVAALIELARAFARDGTPDKNLVFMATAAEEGGKYGSKHYVENPIFPLDATEFVLNIDGFNVAGPTDSYFVMPRQGVDFIDEIESLASSLGWTYDPQDWVDGMNTSFDTAPFLEKGIPACTIWASDPKNEAQKATWVPASRFGGIHSPDDEVSELWNWDGVEAHLRLYKALAEYFLDSSPNVSVTEPELFFDS